MDAETHASTKELLQVPSRKFLVRAGSSLAAVAFVIVATGTVIRDRHHQAIVTWTAAQTVTPVTLAKLNFGATNGALSLPGTIQPYQKAAIFARVSGYLRNWQKDIGARVRAGETLGYIDTPDLDQQLDQAKADLASANANKKLADLTASRWNALVASQSVAQQAADEKNGDAEAKSALRNAAAANVRRLLALEGFKRIAAPFDGVVTARKTDVGALINAGDSGQELFEVADLSKVRIYVNIPQMFAAQLKPGMSATFDMPQYPGRAFNAVLVTTSHAIGDGSGSMLAELQADNASGLFEAGAYTQVHFNLGPDATAVRLPATALAPSDKGTQVAVVGVDGKAHFKTVQLGRDFGDSVEVVAGLSPTDRVIDNPPETLEDGDPVRLGTTVFRKPASGSSARAPQG